LIASAGIDKSNADGYLVLWPEEPMGAARKMHGWLKRKYGIREIGVVVVDSHVTLSRRGTMGIALGWWGFNPVRNYIGKPDIFGNPLKVTLTNVVDGLAAASVVVMGEGMEQTPVAVITDVPWVEFSEDKKIIEGEPDFKISREEDLFQPFLDGVEWKKGEKK
jgi:dihydrofolate synthase / folylpolyglutamate synthase